MSKALATASRARTRGAAHKRIFERTGRRSTDPSVRAPLRLVVELEIERLHRLGPGPGHCYRAHDQADDREADAHEGVHLRAHAAVELMVVQVERVQVQA